MCFSLWLWPLVACFSPLTTECFSKIPLSLCFSTLTKPSFCRLCSTSPSSKSPAWLLAALLCPCPSCPGEPSPSPAHQLCCTSAEQRGKIAPSTCWRWSCSCSHPCCKGCLLADGQLGIHQGSQFFLYRTAFHPVSLRMQRV